MSIDFRAVGEIVLTALQPSVPFAVHAAASATTFAACLGATQVVAYCCRVSCATPILGPVVGALGVGIASCAAGQASIQCRRYYAGRPVGTIVLPRREELLIDACAGILLYKVVGGRFRNVMPSDLFAPGAMARESIPAHGPSYVGPAARAELVRHFRRDGCHHCGKFRGDVVGDHMPPNKQVYGSKSEILNKAKNQLAKKMKFVGGKSKSKSSSLSSAVVQKVANKQLYKFYASVKHVLDPQARMPMQRFYPQCKSCSGKQSVAVKSNKRTLLLHWQGSKRPLLAGVIVGLRHYGFPPGLGPPPNSMPNKKGRQNFNHTGKSDAFGIGRLMGVPLHGLHTLGHMVEQQAEEVVRNAHFRALNLESLAWQIMS